MVTAYGGFSGQLDEKLQLKDAEVPVPTAQEGFTAKQFRVKISNLEEGNLQGNVSAIVRGVLGTLERNIYPDYRDIWDQNNIPEVPKHLIEGKVKKVDTLLNGCLPEIENCRGRPHAQRLVIDPAVPSHGFTVKVTLTFPDLQPGATITGIVALSDE